MLNETSELGSLLMPAVENFAFMHESDTERNAGLIRGTTMDKNVVSWSDVRESTATSDENIMRVIDQMTKGFPEDDRTLPHDVCHY